MKPLLKNDQSQLRQDTSGIKPVEQPKQKAKQTKSKVFVIGQAELVNDVKDGSVSIPAGTTIYIIRKADDYGFARASTNPNYKPPKKVGVKDLDSFYIKLADIGETEISVKPLAEDTTVYPYMELQNGKQGVRDLSEGERKQMIERINQSKVDKGVEDDDLDDFPF